MTKKPIQRSLLAAGLCLLAACTAGSMEVRLEPPALQVESLRIENDRVHFRLLVHNRNDHELLLQSAAMSMRIGNAELFDAAWELDLDIGARGRELVRLDAPAMPIGAEILTGLGASPGTSVEFELSSNIAIDGQRDAETVQEGFLFPVPGQAGQFR
ncbi:MAG: hypothetical protein KGY53_01465 [Wenzhouxiangellaceae bacterium]|nr:hypothetical protein [Wenzhouxiangellaceae bacterium]